MLSGGSPASWSATCGAKTVVVQMTPSGRSVVGLMVKTVFPPLGVMVASAGLTVRTMVAPPAHVSWNQLPVTLTGSLKVMAMSVEGETPVALLSGEVVDTDG